MNRECGGDVKDQNNKIRVVMIFVIFFYGGRTLKLSHNIINIKQL